MAGSTFKTNPVALQKLLQDAEAGKLQLPDFQRSWVWDEERIRSLIASVSRGFPVGAIMTLSAGSDVTPIPHQTSVACWRTLDPSGSVASRLIVRGTCCHERDRDSAQFGFTRPSFTHLIHLYSTQNEGLQSEAANRPVPCKHKGIRGCSETFGNDQIKARTFRGSLVQMKTVHGSCMAGIGRLHRVPLRKPHVER